MGPNAPSHPPLLIGPTEAQNPVSLSQIPPSQKLAFPEAVLLYGPPHPTPGVHGSDGASALPQALGKAPPGTH